MMPKKVNAADMSTHPTVEIRFDEYYVDTRDNIATISDSLRINTNNNIRYPQNHFLLNGFGYSTPGSGTVAELNLISSDFTIGKPIQFLALYQGMGVHEFGVVPAVGGSYNRSITFDDRTNIITYKVNNESYKINRPSFKQYDFPDLKSSYIDEFVEWRTPEDKPYVLTKPFTPKLDVTISNIAMNVGGDPVLPLPKPTSSASNSKLQYPVIFRVVNNNTLQVTPITGNNNKAFTGEQTIRDLLKATREMPMKFSNAY